MESATPFSEQWKYPVSATVINSTRKTESATFVFIPRHSYCSNWGRSKGVANCYVFNTTHLFSAAFQTGRIAFWRIFKKRKGYYALRQLEIFFWMRCFLQIREDNQLKVFQIEKTMSVSQRENSILAIPFYLVFSYFGWFLKQ